MSSPIEPEPRIHPRALVESDNVGAGTRVWAFAHIMSGAEVGEDCNIGEGCFVEDGATLGDHVTLKNGVAVWSGVTIADYAFVGPNVVFTNDLYPRAWVKPPAFQPTHVRRGASIGANATIICGNTLGAFCMVGAGSVITEDVRPLELVVGNPARHHAWVCICGRRLKDLSPRCACGADVRWNDRSEPTVAEDQPAIRGTGIAAFNRGEEESVH